MTQPGPPIEINCVQNSMKIFKISRLSNFTGQSLLKLTPHGYLMLFLQIFDRVSNLSILTLNLRTQLSCSANPLNQTKNILFSPFSLSSRKTCFSLSRASYLFRCQHFLSSLRSCSVRNTSGYFFCKSFLFCNQTVAKKMVERLWHRFRRKRSAVQIQ